LVGILNYWTLSEHVAVSMFVRIVLVELATHHTNIHHNLLFHTDQLVEEDLHHVQLECLKQGRYVSHANYSSYLLLESPLLKAPFSHSAIK